MPGDAEKQHYHNKSTMIAHSDLHKLIRSSLTDHESAKEELKEIFFDAAKSTVVQYSSDETEQLELIELGFMKAFQNLHRVRLDSVKIHDHFKVWLRKMMVYGLVKYFRNKGDLTCFLCLDKSKVCEQLKLDNMSRVLLERKVGLALRELTPVNKMIIHLTLMERLNQWELAECLEVSFDCAQELDKKARIRFAQLLRISQDG